MTDQLITEQLTGEPAAEQLDTENPVTRFDQALTELARSLDGEVLASQDRCVDGLLDLYNAAPTSLVRQLVAQMIDDIRHLSAVRADAILAQLSEVSAALAVELAFC